ncbi:actin- protein 3 [Kalmusia sp. IMI 367209]|nr:actin- protein 3 [Kalmusia sp. IMI 367209]
MWAAKNGVENIVQSYFTDNSNLTLHETAIQEAFLAAIEHGHEGITMLLLKNGADANGRITAPHSYYSYPLHSAAAYGHLPVVKTVIEHGADKGRLEEREWSALHYAAHKGHLEILQALGVDDQVIDRKSNYGDTMLHLAASSGHDNVVRFLVERGADLTATNGGRVTPLHIAMMHVRHPHETTVKLLLSYEIELGIVTDKDETFKDMIRLGHLELIKILLDHDKARLLGPKGRFLELLEKAMLQDQREIAECLVERGADIAASDEEGWTLLHVAAWKGKFSYVNWLITLGADVNHKTNEGESCLHLAVKCNHHPITRLLLQHGIDVSSVDGFNQSPLFLASAQGHNDDVRLLLEKGADQIACLRNGASPLFMAARNGNLELAKMLLGDGIGLTQAFEDGSTLSPRQQASIDAAKDDRFTPLLTAACNGHLEVVNLLLKHGASIAAETHAGDTALDLAILKGHLDVVQALLHAGADVSTHEGEGWTPLYKAALHGQDDIAKLLLEKGAEVNVRCEAMKCSCEEDKELEIDISVRTTPLAAATSNGSVDIVRPLLKNGANPDGETKGCKGEPQLCIAASINSIEIVRLLIEHGVALDLRSINKRTPLHIAATREHQAVAQLLLQRGADVDANEGVITALSLAKDGGHADVVALLKEYVNIIESSTEVGTN